MKEILETFPRVFCFRKSRINKNGGKKEVVMPNLYAAYFVAIANVASSLNIVLFFFKFFYVTFIVFSSG